MEENKEVNVWGEWARGVYNELKEIRSDQNSNFNDLKDIIHENKTDSDKELSKLRNEFIEFKTRVNVRTALISSIFSIIVSGAALIYTVIQIAQKL